MNVVWATTVTVSPRWLLVTQHGLAGEDGQVWAGKMIGLRTPTAYFRTASLTFSPVGSSLISVPPGIGPDEVPDSAPWTIA